MVSFGFPIVCCCVKSPPNFARIICEGGPDAPQCVPKKKLQKV
uniref:Uncharacterized protein n=1 Tax=Rhizophora mucronata TaxID=61149 RepID=A0A2P2QA03_RHIMU